MLYDDASSAEVRPQTLCAARVCRKLVMQLDVSSSGSGQSSSTMIELIRTTLASVRQYQWTIEANLSGGT